MNEPDPVAAALTALVSAIRQQVQHELRAEMPAPTPAPDRAAGPQLLTLIEARTQLRISKATLDRLMSQGRIERVKIGSRTFIPAEEISRFIAESAG
ncbi:DNA-binding protein%2C excisionase family [Mycobacteroides abscessus]|uniref:helix-turn-helix domain-containing protein n=1 Tax=Mycobacteroides abscessus TaxID=36809 RepID=UPI0005E980A4|nr:helix-turn-helix domain-containing protein [Mycobacteroides abscessus]CPS10256.1 DNA-binding protein%2C excisionase family [Mycobacteroides abscessus]CPS50021.1 DNA-binding protein%2C excisionase family [Mycobacteroides abscessus]CPS93806.1 DNA-binding protein%2C excisionase family [Mycobacteroides abscessus]CPS94185.1 DNA-binding protein%2C excisionase family [Mycobacteroides abscessus]CPT62293.1 DNA-binding protein%2C excisionase family [Mycobacteroides abscessus]